MKTCSKCQEKFKTHVKINGQYKNLGSRKFCLKCSPWGQHNTKDLITGPIDLPSEKTCPKCHNIYPRNSKHFYSRKNRRDFSGYCKSCNTVVKMEQIRELKRQCLEHLGGKCLICKYDAYDGALDFHHKKPDEKEFQISKFRSLKFENIVKELNKCVILCATCHREVHGGIRSI